MIFRTLVAALAIVCLALGARSNAVGLGGPFDGLAGRWVGDGRLGFKDGKVEAVKCRATYFVADDAEGLEQNIRCATAGARIEVKSAVRHQAGTLSGTWTELIYNLSGDVSGKVTAQGYKVRVRSSGLTANMEIIVRDGRQIVEIQFHHASLTGLTLILQRG